MAEEQEQDTQKVRRMLEQQAERESLSFQSLIQEYGDFTLSQQPPLQDLGNTNTVLEAPTNIIVQDSVADGSLLDRDSLIIGGTVMGDAQPGPSRRRFEDEIRVLGESGGKKTPLWLQCFFIGGLSLLLLLPIVGKSGFLSFQPWYSYCVVFLGSVTVFWSVYGMLHEDEPKERWLCLIGLGMALVAVSVAWVLRTPPPMY